MTFNNLQKSSDTDTHIYIYDSKITKTHYKLTCNFISYSSLLVVIDIHLDKDNMRVLFTELLIQGSNSLARSTLKIRIYNKLGKKYNHEIRLILYLPTMRNENVVYIYIISRFQSSLQTNKFS
jgi:hypothetical protein